MLLIHNVTFTRDYDNERHHCHVENINGQRTKVNRTRCQSTFVNCLRARACTKTKRRRKKIAFVVFRFDFYFADTSDCTLIDTQRMIQNHRHKIDLMNERKRCEQIMK